MTTSTRKSTRSRSSGASFASPGLDESQTTAQQNQSRSSGKRKSVGAQDTTNTSTNATQSPSAASSSTKVSKGSTKSKDVYKSTPTLSKPSSSAGKASPTTSSTQKYASKFVEPLLSSLISQAENRARNSDAARLWLHKLKASIQKKISIVSQQAFLTPDLDAMEIDREIHAMETQIYQQTKHLQALTQQQITSNKLLSTLMATPSQDITGRFDTTVNSIGSKIHQISEELSSTSEQFNETLSSLQQTLTAVNSNVDTLLEKQQQLGVTVPIVTTTLSSGSGSGTNGGEIAIVPGHGTGMLSEEIHVHVIEPAVQQVAPIVMMEESSKQSSGSGSGKVFHTIPVSSVSFASTATVIAPATTAGSHTPNKVPPMTTSTTPITTTHTFSHNPSRGESILNSAAKLQQLNKQSHVQANKKTNHSNHSNHHTNNPNSNSARDPLSILHDHLHPK